MRSSPDSDVVVPSKRLMQWRRKWHAQRNIGVGDDDDISARQATARNLVTAGEDLQIALGVRNLLGK